MTESTTLISVQVGPGEVRCGAVIFLRFCSVAADLAGLQSTGLYPRMRRQTKSVQDVIYEEGLFGSPKLNKALLTRPVHVLKQRLVG